MAQGIRTSLSIALNNAKGCIFALSDCSVSLRLPNGLIEISRDGHSYLAFFDVCLLKAHAKAVSYQYELKNGCASLKEERLTILADAIRPIRDGDLAGLMGSEIPKEGTTLDMCQGSPEHVRLD